jgi:hypothetical protein
MITYGNNNIYKHKPAMVKGYVDGYYLFLKPLTAGQHILDLKTSVINPQDSSFNYSADLVYHLNIQWLCSILLQIFKSQSTTSLYLLETALKQTAIRCFLIFVAVLQNEKAPVSKYCSYCKGDCSP